MDLESSFRAKIEQVTTYQHILIKVLIKVDC